MSATDLTGNTFNVGDIVNVPCEVTAIGGSPQSGVPNLTLRPNYNDPDDTAPTAITTVYANQVIIDR
jgi:hypothetical protein